MDAQIRDADMIAHMRGVRATAGLGLAALVVTTASVDALSLCPSDRATKRTTCLVDGDTGWEHGRKWRLLAIDAPEISHPGCAAEKRLGIEARDRLLSVMREDYRIERADRVDVYGRDLVTIRSADGRDVGETLMAEGLAQPWPNRGNRWCGR